MSKNFLPVKVNAVLSISKETTLNNIQQNLNTMNVWFDRMFYPNGFQAYIVSAGPSMEKYVTELNLKERMKNPNRSFVVFCVKHALPRLMAMGIEPDFCVILDGRDFDADSTHGINRKSLFEKIPKKTIFMVASMSNPGYAKHLKEQGARLLGWHTAVTGIEELGHLIKGPVIGGGTSSGTRCIAIAHTLGIRDVTLVGFDSCLHNPTKEELSALDEKGRKKYLKVDLPVKPVFSADQRTLLMAIEQMYQKDGLVHQSVIAKPFWTTGELLAQAQDFESFFKSPTYDIKFRVMDDGLVSHIYNNMDGKISRDGSFLEYFRNALPKSS